MSVERSAQRPPAIPDSLLRRLQESVAARRVSQGIALLEANQASSLLLVHLLAGRSSDPAIQQLRL